VCVNIDEKMDWATYWAIFSPTHLVTLFGSRWLRPRRVAVGKLFFVKQLLLRLIEEAGKTFFKIKHTYFE
jgi:hypothetical protein